MVLLIEDVRIDPNEALQEYHVMLQDISRGLFFTWNGSIRHPNTAGGICCSKDLTRRLASCYFEWLVRALK